MQPNALIPELAVVSYPVSRTFYAEVLGFSVVYERLEEGFGFFERDGAQMMFDEIGLGRTFDGGDALVPPLGRGLNLQIRVAALAPLIASLVAASVPFVLPLEDRWYRRGAEEVGNRQCVIADPDGYLLRFYEDLGVRAPSTDL